jgi:hypothetical protein
MGDGPAPGAHDLVVRRGLILGFNIVTRVGLFSDYRRAFWQAAGYALKRLKRSNRCSGE